ncbi:MAG: hypothetical protein H7X88_12945 [Gloeobacteraceae cyanobacterium ES-bin-316]|nr:hypothetical protein [Ferruginibacter sp.]
MKILIILLIAFLTLLIFYFRKDIMSFSEELSLPDQNPELVTYLQGDWAITEDPKSVLRINRDLIMKIYNDTIRGTNSLYYLFTGAASKYFTKDSSFAFSSPGEHSLTTYEFRLKETNNNSTDIVWDTLVYVSKSKLNMISRGKTINLNRVR